jgi:hypothetical protein
MYQFGRFSGGQKGSVDDKRGKSELNPLGSSTEEEKQSQLKRLRDFKARRKPPVPI